MKRIVVLLLVVAIVGTVAYWWRNPDQQPSWVADWIPNDDRAVTVMYRWQTANGQWHISDQPPAQGEFEVVEVVRGTNVVSGSAED